MDAFAGAIGVSESTGKCSPEYVVCEPRDARMVTSMEYFARVLREMAKQGFIFVICPSVRERAPRFRFATFKDVLLPVPPPSEQKQIDGYLTVLAQAAPLVERLKAQVERLREYRQALITAAVTGKLDVTKEAAA